VVSRRSSLGFSGRTLGSGLVFSRRCLLVWWFASSGISSERAVILLHACGLARLPRFGEHLSIHLSSGIFNISAWRKNRSLPSNIVKSQLCSLKEVEEDVFALKIKETKTSDTKVLSIHVDNNSGSLLDILDSEAHSLLQIASADAKHFQMVVFVSLKHDLPPSRHLNGSSNCKRSQIGRKFFQLLALVAEVDTVRFFHIAIFVNGETTLVERIGSICESSSEEHNIGSPSTSSANYRIFVFFFTLQIAAGDGSKLYAISGFWSSDFATHSIIGNIQRTSNCQSSFSVRILATKIFCYKCVHIRKSPKEISRSYPYKG
jgi:hypothetical protein